MRLTQDELFSIFKNEHFLRKDKKMSFINQYYFNFKVHEKNKMIHKIEKKRKKREYILKNTENEEKVFLKKSLGQIFVLRKICSFLFSCIFNIRF